MGHVVGFGFVFLRHFSTPLLCGFLKAIENGDRFTQDIMLVLVELAESVGKGLGTGR